MSPVLPRLRPLAAVLLLLPAATLPAPPEPPPPGFKVAFLGDQGLGPASEATLQLVKAEGAHLLVHLGDFDYLSDPEAWEAQTDRILGPDFPMVAVVGNHDIFSWNGPRGYAQFVRARLRKMGVEVNGEAGVQCSFRYRGIFFVMTAPGVMGSGHPDFIRRELEADSSLWRVSAWHVNQALMQVGTKPDEAGWAVYEESRKGGAIIATAHEHSYSRTHLLSAMTRPAIASRSDTLKLERGKTFAFVAGLGGGDIRPQYRSGAWWAKVYTASQGARHGALFATFHVDGDPRRASFRFKAVDGTEVDRFEAVSEVDRPAPPDPPDTGAPPAHPRLPRGPRVLELDPAALGVPPGTRVVLEDASGRVLARVESLRDPLTLPMRKPGLVFLRLQTREGVRLRKMVILP